MRFTLQRLTQPAIEPVSLAEIIQHVREYTTIDTATQNELTGLVTAAREWVEDYTGRALVDQTWRLTLLGRPGSYAGGDNVYGTHDGRLPVGYGYYSGQLQIGRQGEIPLQKSPLLQITKFVTLDAAGLETDVDAATYELRDGGAKWPRVVALNGATWSTWLTGDMRIEYRAGFADQTGSPQTGAEVVPERFKQAIKLWVEANYNRDEKMMPLLLKTAEDIIRSESSDLSLA